MADHADVGLTLRELVLDVRSDVKDIRGRVEALERADAAGSTWRKVREGALQVVVTLLVSGGVSAAALAMTGNLG